jgi:Mg/Co/Ni transporter MgtE
MADRKELPQLVTELVDLSKEYLRQETIEPAKALGRFAGIGLAAGLVFAVAAVFGGLAAYALYRQVLPAGDWWVVLARGLTVLTTAAFAGLIGWRITKT